MNGKKKIRLTLSQKRSLLGYAYTLPFTIGFIFFVLTPVMLFIVMGFSSISMSDTGMKFTYVGLANYNEVLFVQTNNYIQSVIGSILSMGINLPSILVFSLFISTLLNQKFKGRSLFRAVFFFPVLISLAFGVLSTQDTLMRGAFNAVTGKLAQTNTFDLASIVVRLFGDAFNSTFITIVNTIIGNMSMIVMSSGIQILIFLAGLQTISPSIYEASRIDGSTAWEDFWKITLPMISPLILVNAVYTVIDLLSSENNIVINNIYQITMMEGRLSWGSAMGTVYFSIVFLLLGIIIFALSKVVYYEDR
ncbi:MAG: carbohydrate ABC transporter permease [Saccharofermentanales bacterium]